MKHRLAKGLTALAVGGLILGAASLPPAHADHCGPIFVFSGHHAATTFGPSANPGAGACVLRDDNVNSNYLLPGATFILVGTTATPVGVPAAPLAVGATVTAGDVVIDDGTPIPLTFTWSGTRWNSQRITLDGGTVVTASVPSVTGVTVSNTYRAVTEEVGA